MRGCKSFFRTRCYKKKQAHTSILLYECWGCFTSFFNTQSSSTAETLYVKWHWNNRMLIVNTDAGHIKLLSSYCILYPYILHYIYILSMFSSCCHNDRIIMSNIFVVSSCCFEKRWFSNLFRNSQMLLTGVQPNMTQLWSSKCNYITLRSFYIILFSSCTYKYWWNNKCNGLPGLPF